MTKKLCLSPTGVIPGALCLLVASALAAEAAKSYTLSPAWSIAPTTPYEWVSTGHHQRGLAYNPVTGDLITVSRYPAFAAAGYVLNSTNGALKGNLNMTGVKTDMNFPINTIGVADDGVIYACNLAVDSATVPAEPMNNNGPLRIYRWVNADAVPQLAYEGAPSASDPIAAGRRFGDTIIVRGAGTATEILFSNRSTNTLSLFRTTDGVNFQPAIRIYAPDMPLGTTQAGIAWGTNNTFYAKGESGGDAGKTAVQHFSYDEAGVATLIKNHDNLKAFGGPIAYDQTKGLLAVARVLSTVIDTPHEVRLFKDTIAGMVQQDHPDYVRLFPTMNVNGNGTGVAVFGGGRLFALSSNNGIVAYDIVEKEVTPQIFWTEAGGFTVPENGFVWSAAFDGSGKNPVGAKLSRPIGIDLDYTNRHVYWAEDGDSLHPSRIVRANFDGTGLTELFKGDELGFNNAQMLKLDLANGHVYWNAFSGGVCRGKLNGSEFTWLAGHPNGLTYTGLELDLVNDRIYYADPQQSGVLFRMDFDGQNNIEVARPVAGGDWAFNAMRLDVANNLIYWADGAANQIKRMNLDGTSQAVVVDQAGGSPLDVVLAPDGRMYWTASDSLGICSANMDGSDMKTNVVAASGTAFAIATVPVAPAVPALVSIKVSGNTATISWTGGAGMFQLQKRTSLVSGTWQNVGSATTATEATDPTIVDGCFYRVISTR